MEGIKGRLYAGPSRLLPGMSGSSRGSLLGRRFRLINGGANI